MSLPSATLPTKAQIRRAFDRAAADYDRIAQVQRAACDRLETLAPAPASSRDKVQSILDLGCGTGFGVTLLRRRFPAARICALDLAPAMLGSPALTDAHCVCGDMEALPFADCTAHLVWSSLALQWCSAGPALHECGRVLAPGGHLWLATLGPDTLAEVADAFTAADDFPHVLSFAAPEALVRHLRAAGLEILRADRITLRAWEPDLATLLRNIRTLGAGTLGSDRRPVALGREGWRAVQARFERHRTQQGVPASYDVLSFIAQRPA